MKLEAWIKKGVLNSLNVTFGRFGFISKWHDPIMLKVPKHTFETAIDIRLDNRLRLVYSEMLERMGKLL